MDSIGQAILHLHGWAVVGLVFALPALEASAFVGFVFPGEIALLLGGVAAFEGRASLALVMVAAMLGAVVGDTVGFAIGRRFGPPLLARIPERLLKPEHVAKATAAVNRLGGRAVFVGRFTAALRVLVPGLSGMARMPYRTFAVWNVAGGVLWAGGSVALGYLAGTGWRAIQHTISVGGFVLAGVVVLGLLAVWLVRRRRARAAEATPDVEAVPVGAAVGFAIEEPAD